ncbi:MAG: SDR family oxidoreductase [Pegethrix bostrychoides GSE-TBD4-15B]|uniref:SDR family oxidoreductase n=1 Tax=Pegethrix bostrychoides GSE-TBD4-15B TaxID=2839662 RepID=A0A951U3K2_9CYAN|nr:SDR family oxidoreductase [Pegethrix bostrychoides GSE-TBD4-15B]
MIDLSEKVVLVTGSSQGIGAAIALTLAQAGARVILHYGQSQDKAAEIAQQTNGYLVQADLSQPGAAQILWQKAQAWQGNIDVIVNNAAIMPAAGVEDEWEVWTATWQTTLQVNLVAVADLCRCAISHFQSRQGGTIINIASRAAFRGDGPEYMHYAASKGGVISLTRSIARSFASDQILAYAVAPGFVLTERTAAVMQEKGADSVTSDIPMGQPVPPQEVANIVAFLASGLAPHATGSTFDINGASYLR